jgi:putative DNA methylase
MAERPEVLIEKWFPIDTIGAESMRERGASSALPPLYFLHVWWARRPLITSRAAILGSVLPAWRKDWPKPLRTKFPTEESYHEWFKLLCGIFGDPVAGRKLIAWAKEKNEKLKISPYTHKRAFTINPSNDYLETMKQLLEHTWGTSDLNVLDPFSGGGSIPFEALRYGFRTYANELNPVASVILKATLDYPFRFGGGLTQDIHKYGKLLIDRVRQRLEPYFPLQPGESIHAYIWARTVACPYTGKPIPLSPNWWIQKGSDPVAVRPIFDDNEKMARFEILRGTKAIERAKFDPNVGTVKGGNAVSAWAHNQPVDGDYIKAEAQAGRMGQQLYALAIKKDGLSFRAPNAADLAAATAAEVELLNRMPEWEAKGLVPNEVIPDGNKTSEPRRYGIHNWNEMFAPRQLLSMCTFVELLKEIQTLIRKDLPADRAAAVETYLGIPLDKAANYNSRMVRWHSGRGVVVGTFDRHDFSFKWSHAEFDAAHNLVPWAIDQVADSFQGIANLAISPLPLLEHPELHPLIISRGSATSMSGIADGSLHHISTDPPYEANVMYAECSDFFYVWMKRTLGDVYPGFFSEELTNKDDEAVANVARFAAMGRKRTALALTDYERKMAAAFREMHRVLRDDGILTVMFTHKKVEAWDTLATSLIGAGFKICSSWPVHTESEHSLHQAKKNSAASTIMLTCKKRDTSHESVWWDDLKNRVRQEARDKAAQFEKDGIRGVDLYIATFGPVLSILSENWPVLTSEVDERTGEPKPLRPEVALDLAREEVVQLRKRGLLLGRAVQFDPYTDWYLMAWDAFKAIEFPADEARKLALALGLDLERDIIKDKKLVGKKASTVVLQVPLARRKRDMVDPDKTSFDCWIDAAHTAMMLYVEDGAQSCKAFLNNAGLLNDSTFKACLQALVNAIPRTKQKGKFIRPEAAALENLCLAFFPDITLPAEEAPPEIPQQGMLAGMGAEEEIEDEEIEDDGDDEGDED